MSRQPDITKIAAAVVVFANAVLLAVLGIADLTWTDPQKGAVAVLVNTSAALGVALYAHFRPGTATEPVAVGVSAIAFSSALLGVATVFAWWSITPADAVLLQGVTVAAVSVLTLLFARSVVTPEKDAVARERHAASASLRRP